MAARRGLVGRVADAYIRWLFERRLALPTPTKMSRHLKQECRSLHEAALAGTLDGADAGRYREERRYVVTMTAVAVMLLAIGIAGGVDAIGLGVLNTPLVVCFAVLTGAHVVLLAWLALPNKARG